MSVKSLPKRFSSNSPWFDYDNAVESANVTAVSTHIEVEMDSNRTDESALSTNVKIDVPRPSEDADAVMVFATVEVVVATKVLARPGRVGAARIRAVEVPIVVIPELAPEMVAPFEEVET
jgi:hypothetical protein